MTKKQKPDRSRAFKNPQKLLYGSQAGTQAGLIPGCGILVNGALLYGLVDHGNGAAEGPFGLLAVARLQRLAEAAERCAQT